MRRSSRAPTVQFARTMRPFSPSAVKRQEEIRSSILKDESRDREKERSSQGTKAAMIFFFLREISVTPAR